MSSLHHRLQNRLSAQLDLLAEDKALLKEVNIGLERETLRVDAKQGRISDQSHPKALGSALTNSHITTDFAEPLLEFVTNPGSTPEKALAELSEIQRFTLSQLDNELFWPNSMPPIIESEDEITIAHYGTSNDAKMKSLYRKGLSLRYGKMMQVISGIHYNFSFKDAVFKAWKEAAQFNGSLQDFKTARYLHACRNVSRYGYIIPFFLGASPVMDKSFLADKENTFESLNDTDSYLSKGESLRLSDIGYGNNKCHFDVSFNSIDTFVENIHYAITTPCSIFSKIPVIENGEYNQINNHILQIENEYYASIRPKQIVKKGENFLTALKKRGIEYIELRSIDINPLIAEGIDLESMRFIQLFLTASVLTDAPELSQKEYEHNQKNLKQVAKQGLSLNDEIVIESEPMTLQTALEATLDWLAPIALLLGTPYQDALKNMQAKLQNPALLPSQIVLNRLQESGERYQDFFLNQAQVLYQQSHTSLDTNTMEKYQQIAQESLEKLDQLEAAPQISFAEHLANYFKF